MGTLALPCPGILPFGPSCPGFGAPHEQLGPGAAVGRFGCTGRPAPQRARRGGLGRNPTPAWAPPRGQMAGTRAGPGPPFRARVSAVRGGAGSRGPAEVAANHRQAGTSSRQSQPGSVAPAPPCPLFPVTLAVLGAAPTARLPSSGPVTSGPYGPGCVLAIVYLVCARASVQGPPLPVPRRSRPASRHRPAGGLAHSSARPGPRDPEGPSQSPKKALLRG